jgi:hypothetical protein
MCNVRVPKVYIYPVTRMSYASREGELFPTSYEEMVGESMAVVINTSFDIVLQGVLLEERQELLFSTSRNGRNLRAGIRSVMLYDAA